MIFRKLLFRLDTLAFAFLLLLAPCARTQSIYGDALQFTVGGPNQSVTVPNFGSIIPTNEITVEFWALSTAFATQSAFMLNPDQGTNRFNAHINYNNPSPGVTYWDFGNISGGGRLGPVPAPANSIGSWVHYAMVASQSGNYMRIYTNGVLQSSQTGMNTFVRGSYNLQIAGPGFPYGGILDEFRVWSVARTPAQIQADIYSILSGSESNLVVYYKFDNTSGTVATNSATATGAAYNGTVVNGPTWMSATIPLAVYVVTNIADSGPGTLRTIVANAPPGALVTFAPALAGQMILLANGPISLNNNITIDAGALAEGITINPNYASRIFTISSATAVLNSLILTNGNGSPTPGGAIQNNSGIVTLNYCGFYGNASYYSMGGAVANLQGTMTVNSCCFSNNYASFSQSSSIAGGGAIYNQLARLTVNNCTFLDNHADSAAGGGAVWSTGGFPATVNNCTFLVNHADSSSGGGAIRDDSGSPVTVNNCTFVGNTATNSSGGGVYTTGNLGMTNCILYTNTASSGAEVYCGNTLSLVTSLTGPEPLSSASIASGSSVTSGDLFGYNPLLAPFGNYGGPTPTLWPSPGSPAINVGSDSVTSFLGFDQRGLPRKAGTHVDIGAVEVEPTDTNAANAIVTTTADSGFGSLRIAALLASSGTTNRITFASSLSNQTIVLLNGEIFLTNNITVDASALAGGIQINGNSHSRIFEIAANSTVVLNSLTIANGHAYAPNYGGGGILSQGTLTINNSTIAHNDASYGDGGGIYSISGPLTVNNCVITGNKSESPGGGISTSGSPLTVINSTISGNESESDNGGGLAVYGPMTVNNCTISGNAADDGGGGMDLENVMSVINNSTISGNESSGDGNPSESGGGGGGLVVRGGTTELNNCTIAGNQANFGGGISVPLPGIVTLRNCTIAGNQASESGGGGILINNSYFNGVLAASQFLVNITNCICYSNTAASEGLELCNLDGTMNLSYCLLGPEGLASLYSTGNTTNDNSLVAVNPMLAPPGYFGGPTQTMPPEPGSQAIGAGNVTAASLLSTDQRGYARVVLGKVDVGAVEIQGGQSYPIVLNTLDSGAGSLRQLVSNAPAGATVTFDPGLAGQTITLTSGQIVLSNSITIDGSTLNSGVQINGHGTSRIFQLNSGTLAILNSLTLTNGNPGGANAGGAIIAASESLLEIAACTLAGNSSSQGGAIENAGSCVLIECTVAGNHANNNGGAIDNNQGLLQLFQCTLNDNSSGGFGGGVANYQNTLAVTNCVLAGNTSTIGGGGSDIYNFPASIVSAGGSNLVQSVVNNGGTLNGNSTFIFKAPLLSPLGNYGGLTATMPPLPGSPALDGGSTLAAGNLPTDQRGYYRFRGARVDIGAVEIQGASAPYSIPGLTRLADGTVQFSFTNIAWGSFTVFATTNLARPANLWLNLGSAQETPPGSGQFQFTDPQSTTNFPCRFYRVTSP